MTEVTEEKIRASQFHLLLWRKIYNRVHRCCKSKLFHAIVDIKERGTQNAVERMDHILNHELCYACKNRIKTIMKNYEEK